MTAKYGQETREKPKESTTDKPFSIRRWITGENRYDWPQVFGHLGAPYLRYDPSHHLHRQISRMRLAKNLLTHLLAVWLILMGVLQLVPFIIPGFHILLAIPAIAAGILILLDRGRETKDKSQHNP